MHGVPLLVFANKQVRTQQQRSCIPTRRNISIGESRMGPAACGRAAWPRPCAWVPRWPSAAIRLRWAGPCAA
jgi:hypothetical protein